MRRSASCSEPTNRLWRSRLRSEFESAGYCGPIDVLTAWECASLGRYFDGKDRPAPLDWDKGMAASDRVVYEIATRPRLLSVVTDLVGPDVILWGASVVDRDPGQPHVWHTDIESSAPDARFVTAWIGLENTSLESSLRVIHGSHRIGKPLQQVAAEVGIARDDRSAAVALDLARRHDANARVVEPHMHDGQALLFDGRTWHGSLNTRQHGRRKALLLQYAAAGCPVRIPDWSHLNWPFVLRSSPLPRVIPVAGKLSRRVNRVVAAPPRSRGDIDPLRSLAQAIPWPLPRDTARGWRPSPFFRGSTPVLRHLGCHASVLEPGHCPHPPHSHFDEELLVVLDGEADIVIAESADDAEPKVCRMKAGDIVYYPSFQFHTIRCPGPSPVTYLMYRWQGPLAGSERPLQNEIFRVDDGSAFPEGRPFGTSLVFEGSTGFLEMLHVHRSRAKTDGGYADHKDAHDVAILLTKGRVETLGRKIDAPAVVFYPAGAMHGLRGASADPAEYLVVEFHGPHAPPESIATLLLRAAKRRAAAMERRIRRAIPLLHR